MVWTWANALPVHFLPLPRRVPMMPLATIRLSSARQIARRVSHVFTVLLLACGGGGEGTPGPVTPPPPTPVASVSLSHNTAVLQVGVVLQMTAIPRSAAGAALTGRTITWASSAPTVATVSADGLVSGGTASVTATSEGQSASATVTVVQVASIAIAGPSTVEIGVPATATAEVRTTTGAVLNAPVVWSSSNPNVVSVNSSGALTGVAAGTATISGVAQGVTGTLAVTVVPRNINAMVDSVRIARGLPALIGAVVTRSGGVVAIGVGGTRRATGGAAATVNDLWHIGSNLKAITGLLAAVAVKQGRITWTTTVASMFPELGTNIRAEYRDVTLADLLAMAGGVRNDPPQAAWAGATARAQRETAAAWGLAATPIGARGAFYYSNISYVIAGAMIERAMNGTYEDLLRSAIGTPVGATQIGFGPTTGVGSSAQPVGHTRSGSAWVVCEACDNPPGLSAAGRSHMSMSDWARIIQELMKADAGTSTVVDQVDARRAVTGATPVTGGNPYGLGWITGTRPWGGRTVWHEGTNTFNHSVAWVGLDNGVAFLAATNAADNVGGTSSAAMDAMVGRLLTLHQTGR
jgi:D-alanyl-D-alanine carboxypeptidase